MNELIRVNDNGERQTTSARELWTALDRPYDQFTKWFDKYREYGFTEEEDYRELSTKVLTSNGAAHDAVDYEISIDMAKELAMLQRSEKGKQVRQYLIALEKAWNTPELIMARALKMSETKMLEYKNNITHLERKIEVDKPKVIFADSVTASHTSILVGELAKILKQNGVDTGQNRLFDWLRGNEYLIKRNGSDFNMPTQKSMDLGLFEIKETSITNPDGSIRVSKTPKVTGKGQIYFINKLVSKDDGTLDKQ